MSHDAMLKYVEWDECLKFNWLTPLFRRPVRDWERGLQVRGSGIHSWVFGIVAVRAVWGEMMVTRIAKADRCGNDESDRSSIICIMDN